MIISIGGPAGSGKSTIARMLAEKLGWPRFYMGGLRRQKAQEKGMTLAEYNKLGETDPATDREVDEYQVELAEKNADCIIEGRTTWHFVPQSLKLYIDVDEAEGARRIMKNLEEAAHERNEDKPLSDFNDVLASVSQRRQSDVARYAKYYGIDVYDRKNYDITISTTGKTLDEAWNEVWSVVQKELEAGR